MAVCRDIGCAFAVTVKYGTEMGIHIIRTKILAAQEPPLPPLPRASKYHSKSHALWIRKNVSHRPEMLLAEKEFSDSRLRNEGSL
jgi:hypothetical protein